MKFDIFYQLPQAGAQDPARRYRELIDECVEADRLGFDTVWLAEVHFAPRFSLMPAPMMLLAAIAERTRRLRLGLAVNLLPLHHPMRLAEETAMLDVISGGRAEFGAGRGAFPLNYRGYGVPVVESRELFEETLEFVKRAWTEERVTFHGTHFSADGVSVIPKPVQRPHPPIRLAANSLETFEFAGAHAYPIFAGGPVNPIPVLGDRLQVYERALAGSGRARPADWLAGLLMVFVGRDRTSVRTAIEPSLRNYFNSVAEIVEPETLAPAHQAEFDRVVTRLRTIQYETVDEIMAAFGEPAHCADKIAQYVERFGCTRMVCWFETGGMQGHERIVESMRLFAGKVMPRFG
jgi:alkanesulfonate monooxygenase SsuD/methylene tetrahydromethanopterin reductase-like flavin-dependent oxidoreductase (luciferase family)